MFQNIYNKTIFLKVRGLFGKFVEFGHKMFKYLYSPFIFLISQVDINELASRSLQ